ncbi:MAG: hypothetical protein HQL17_04805, partial [Candidatus Omnitrophica bacterium]|nr:hypothetical protein [Candidatus Omnitrophota bacterium]
MKNNNLFLVTLIVIFLASNTPCPYVMASDMGELVRKDEIYFLQEDLKGLKDKLISRESELSRVTADKESLRLALDFIKTEKDLLQARVDRLQKDVFDQERIVAEKVSQATTVIQGQARQLEQELRLAKISVDQKNERLSELTAQQTDLAQQLMMAKVEQDKLRAELARINVSLADAKVGVDARVAAEQSMSQEKIKQITASFEGQLKGAKDDAARLKNDIAAREADIAAGLREKKDLTDLLSAMTSEKDGLALKLSGDSRALGEKVALLQKNLEEWQAKASEKQARIDALQADNASVKKALAQADAARVDLERSMAALAEQVKAFKAQQASAAAEGDRAVASVRAEMDALKQTLTAKVAAAKLPLEGKLAQLSEQLKDAQTSVPGKVTEARKPLEDAIAKLNAQLKELDASIPSKIAEARKPLEDRLAQLGVQAENLSAQLKDRSSTVAEVSRERDALQAELKTAQALSAKLTAGLVQAQAELKGAQEKVPEQLSLVRMPLEAKLAEVQQVLKQSQAEAQEKAGALAKLNDQCRTLQDELAGVAKSKALVDQELTSVQEALKAQNSTVAQQVADAKEPLLEQIQTLKTQHENAVDAGKQAVATVRAELSALEASMASKIVEAKKPLEDKLAQLSAQSDNLSAQLKERSSVIAEVSKERDALNVQLKAAQDQSSKLAGSLAQAQAALKDTQDKMPGQLASVRAPLEAKVADVEQGLKQAQAEVQEKAAALAKLNDQYRALQNELGGVGQSKASIEKELISAQESLKALNAFIPSKMAEARKPLEDKLAQLGTQSERLTAQLKDNASVIAEVSQERDAVNAQLKAAQEQSSKLAGSLAQAQAALKEAQDKMPEQLASVRVPLEARVAEVQQGLRQAQAEALAKADALVKLNDQYRTLQNELGGVGQSKASIEKELMSAQESLKALNASIPSKISDARKPLEDKLAQLSEQLKAVEASVPSKISDARKPLEDKLALLSAQSGNLNSQLKNNAALIVEVSKERDALNAQLKASQDQSGKLAGSLAQAQAALKDALDKMPGQLASVRAPLEAKVADVEQGLKQAQAEALAKTDALVKLNDQYHALQNELGGVSQSKASVEKELISAQESLKALNASILSKISDARKPLEDKLAQLGAQSENLNAQLKDRSSVIAEVSKERDALSAQLKASQDQSGKLAGSLAQAQAALKDAQDKMPVQLASARAPLEAKVAEAQQGLKQAQAEALAKTDALVKLNDQYHALQNELGGVSQSKASVEKELMSAQESLKALNASIPSKISDARKPLEDKLVQLGAQSENLNAQLKDRSSVIAEVSKERDALSAQLKASQD